MARLARPKASWVSICWMTAALLAAIAAPARAQFVDAHTAEERVRIQAERRQAEQKFENKRAECRRRFLETSCENEATSERRRVVNQLNDREAAVELAERKERAAERLERIRGKQQGDAAKQREAAAAKRSQMGADKQAKQAEPAQEPASEAAVAPDLSKPQHRAPLTCPAGTSLRGNQCVAGSGASAAQAYKEKQAQAQAHRGALERRRASKDPAKAGKPLPLPPAASAPPGNP